MAQPLRRDAVLPPPGRPDAEAGEFWVGNPWLFHAAKRNLSAYERNRVYLNHRGQQYFDISYLTDADSDGDGRSIVAGDFNHDGMLELVVRQVGGGAVLLFENRFPRHHWLQVSLRGVRSNSLGIGSRLVAEVDGRRIVRELYPANAFSSQMPSCVHFGLAESTEVQRLTIRWPSGTEQVLTHLPADQHIEVTEGESELRRASRL